MSQIQLHEVEVERPYHLEVGHLGLWAVPRPAAQSDGLLELTFQLLHPQLGALSTLPGENERLLKYMGMPCLKEQDSDNIVFSHVLSKCCFLSRTINIF